MVMCETTAAQSWGAAVAPLLFPTLAFGAQMPEIVLLQFLAKTAGGALWSQLLSRHLT